MEKLSFLKPAPRNSVDALPPHSASQTDLLSLVQSAAALCSGLLLLLAVMVLVGWVVRSEMLISVLPGRVSMKANTAICFLWSGSALLLNVSKVRWGKGWSRAASSGVLLLAGLSLIEYRFAVDLHIDQIFFKDTSQHVYPGRMSQVTAVAFCFTGVALLLMIKNRLAQRLSQLIGLALISLAYTSIVGYLYGVSLFYGASRNANSMALHTGLAMLVLGFGIVAEPMDSTIVRLLTSRERGGWLTRRFLPVLAFFPVLLGYFYLRPAVNFGELRFGMALFALTLVLGGTILLLVVGLFFNHAERREQALAEESRRAAAAIEVSERELRLLTDHLPLLLAYIDVEGRYLRVNHSYQEWLGIPTEKVIGRTVRELLGEPYWQSTEEVRKTAQQGKQVHFEALYPTTRGQRRAQLTYVPYMGDAGTVLGFMCMVLDVEDQRRAEEGLRQSEKLAAVGRLASSIAHEINNPIDAAMNLLFLVQEETTDQGMKNLLDTATGELKRVANIAGKTLGFHKQTAYPELVAAKDLFDSVLTLHQGRLRHREIRVERRERALQRVGCIEGEIRQVLNNLISNAIDAMLPGGTLRLRTREATEWRSGRRGVTLTIADNGCGMDKETLGRVFEAFYTTKGAGGTGLGLWISAEILGRHGSRLLVRSCAGGVPHGTIFAIFLPFEAPVHPSAQVPEGLVLERRWKLQEADFAAADDFGGAGEEHGGVV